MAWSHVQSQGIKVMGELSLPVPTAGWLYLGRFHKPVLLMVIIWLILSVSIVIPGIAKMSEQQQQQEEKHTKTAFGADYYVHAHDGYPSPSQGRYIAASWARPS